MFIVRLSYFRTTGRFAGRGEYESAKPALPQVWDEVKEKRRFGSLPELQPGRGRDLIVLVEIDGHMPHLEMPVGFELDHDVTPIEVPVLPFPHRKK